MLLFIFLDTISILLSILLATFFGGRYGSEFYPNILILIVFFFLIRALLYWLLFKSYIKRNLDWLRNFFQTLFIIISLSTLTFGLASMPTNFFDNEGNLGKIVLFFTSVDGAIYYFVILPVLTAILSFILHKIYKLEPW